MKPIITTLLLLFTFVDISAQGTKKRVTAWSRHSIVNRTDFAVHDSFSFHYGKQRGSWFDFDRLTYLFADYHYPGYWGDLTLYEPVTTGEFGIRKMRVAADSIRMYRYSESDAQLHLYATGRYDYTPAGNVLSLGEEINGSSYFHQDATYDQSGNCTKVTQLGGENGGSDTSLVRYLFYNASNQLVRDSSFTHAPFSGRPADMIGYISYSGQLCTRNILKVWDFGRYRAVDSIAYDYYSGGKVKTITRWFTTTGSPRKMVLHDKDSFGYAAGKAYPALHQIFGLVNGFSLQEQRVVDRMNAAGYPDSVTIFRNDGTGYIAPIEGKRIYYDAENNPLRIDITFVSLPSPYIAWKEYFYYEPSTLGIGNAVVSTGAFSLYPNPSKGHVTIQCATQHPLSVHFSLTDLSGRLVQQERLTLAGSSHEFQLREGLPAGEYIVVLRDKNGAVLFTSKVLRD